MFEDKNEDGSIDVVEYVYERKDHITTRRFMASFLKAHSVISGIAGIGTRLILAHRTQSWKPILSHAAILLGTYAASGLKDKLIYQTNSYYLARLLQIATGVHATWDTTNTFLDTCADLAKGDVLDIPFTLRPSVIARHFARPEIINTMLASVTSLTSGGSYLTQWIEARKMEQDVLAAPANAPAYWQIIGSRRYPKIETERKTPEDAMWSDLFAYFSKHLKPYLQVYEYQRNVCTSNEELEKYNKETGQNSHKRLARRAVHKTIADLRGRSIITPITDPNGAAERERLQQRMYTIPSYQRYPLQKTAEPLPDSWRGLTLGTRQINDKDKAMLAEHIQQMESVFAQKRKTERKDLAAEQQTAALQRDAFYQKIAQARATRYAHSERYTQVGIHALKARNFEKDIEQATKPETKEEKHEILDVADLMHQLAETKYSDADRRKLLQQHIDELAQIKAQIGTAQDDLKPFIKRKLALAQRLAWLEAEINKDPQAQNVNDLRQQINVLTATNRKLSYFITEKSRKIADTRYEKPEKDLKKLRTARSSFQYTRATLVANYKHARTEYYNAREGKRNAEAQKQTLKEPQAALRAATDALRNDLQKELAYLNKLKNEMRNGRTEETIYGTFRNKAEIEQRITKLTHDIDALPKPKSLESAQTQQPVLSLGILNNSQQQASSSQGSDAAGAPQQSEECVIS